MNSTWIVGAAPTEGRHKNDYYPTPPEVTKALIEFLELPEGTTIWECACGSGDMANVFRNNGYKTIATDIAFGMDFLTCDVQECDWIITNPPFTHAEAFIRRAWEIGKPFAFLLKTQYWHSKKRLPLFLEHKPTCVCPLTWRPDFTGKGNSLMDMIWCVWNPGISVLPTFYVPLIKPEEGK